VLEWINEMVSSIQPDLMTPPPVLSRVYQELSNGMLGFNQSLKLADVPFPFIFAQILEACLVIFLIGAPIMVVVVTGTDLNHWITPFATSVVVMGFWSLNEMAKELENPFGDDTNDVPIVNGHERFVEALTQLFYAQIPEDQMFVDKPEPEETAKPKPEAATPAAPPPPPPPPAPMAETKPVSAGSAREAGAALAASVQVLVDRLDSSVQANTLQLRELHGVLADVAAMRASINDVFMTNNSASRKVVVDQANPSTPRGGEPSACCQTAFPPNRS